jgi:hypothetical protein
VRKKHKFVIKNREKKKTCSLEKVVKKKHFRYEKKVLLILFVSLMTFVCEYLFVSRVKQSFFLRWFLIALISFRVNVECIKSSSHRRHNKREVSFFARTHSIKYCQFLLDRLISFHLIWWSLFSIVKLTFLISYDVKYYHCLNSFWILFISFLFFIFFDHKISSLSWSSRINATEAISALELLEELSTKEEA